MNKKTKTLSSKPCVIFAIPSLTHTVSLETFRSGIETVIALGERGASYGFKQVTGNQFIAVARNQLVWEALTEFPMMTDLFFIDDDIGFPAHKVLEFLDAPEDIVAGSYPKKQDAPEFPVELEVTDRGLVKNARGLYRAISAPTGFMRIKRKVLEELSAKSPPYFEPVEGGGTAERRAIFEAGVHYEEKRFWGEDYTFCRKARSLGFEIWVDPDIEFSHRGTKKWVASFLPSIHAWEKENKAKFAATGADR